MFILKELNTVEGEVWFRDYPLPTGEGAALKPWNIWKGSLILTPCARFVYVWRVKIVDMKSFLEEVQKRWFLLGIVAVITLAKLEPFLGAKGGACYMICMFLLRGVVQQNASPSPF